MKSGGPTTVLAVAAATLALGCRSAPPPQSPDRAVAAATPPQASESESPGAADTGTQARESNSFRNVIKWATASELNNFGFDVYRGESEDGPFQRINSDVIEGAGTSDTPHYYRHVDDSIDPRKTYYYYVESISMSGERRRFTPIDRAGPKIE
jgi:hypothetical protein